MRKNQWAVNVLEDNMEDYSLEEKVSYLRDVTEHGCVSGCVSGVIYYSETSKLFKDNMTEILETIEEFDFETGSNFLGTIDASSIPNTAVWLVVEMVAADMYPEVYAELEEEQEELEEA